LDESNQIFVGKVVSEFTVSDTIKFHFDVIKLWKGKMDTKSTVIIGTSTGSCRVDFQLGETYIVYARNGYTNICLRNKKLEDTFDDRLLDHYFKGKPISDKLDEQDQKVLNNRVIPEASADQNIAIVYDYRILSPKEIYTLHPMQLNKGKYELLELNAEEKASIGGCIDKVIVMGYVTPKKGWNRSKALKAVRKKKLCE
jgi:hypothetical protein